VRFKADSTEIVMKMLGKERGQKFLEQSGEDYGDQLMGKIMPSVFYKTPKNLEEMVEFSKEIEAYMAANPIIHSDSEEENADSEKRQEEEEEFDELLENIANDSDAEPDELLQDLQKKSDALNNNLENDYQEFSTAKQEAEAQEGSRQKVSKKDFQKFAESRKKK